MFGLFARPRGPFLRLLAATAMVGLLAGVGCSDDDDDNGNGGTPTPTTTMTGAFVGSGDGGRMSVTISSTMLAPGLRAAKIEWGAGGGRILGAGSLATHDIAANGSIDLDGGPVVTLTGTYNEESDTLNLLGGGYTFVGEYDSTGSLPAITGGYVGPNGIGFFGVLQGTSSTIQVFCGSFENTDASTTGRWNMILSGDELGGAAFPDGDVDGLGFEGIVTGTGNPRTITIQGEGSGGSLTGTGSWNTTTNVITGTWETSDGINVLDSGTWEGSPCD